MKNVMKRKEMKEKGRKRKNGISAYAIEAMEKHLTKWPFKMAKNTKIIIQKKKVEPKKY